MVWSSPLRAGPHANFIQVASLSKTRPKARSSSISTYLPTLPCLFIPRPFSIGRSNFIMPTQVVGKLSDASMDLDNESESPAAKFRKLHNLKERGRVKLALADISRKIQRSETHDILLDRLAQQPGLAKQIYEFQATITRSIHDANPLNPELLIKHCERRINYESHNLRGHGDEVRKAMDVRSFIMEKVEDDVVTRILDRRSRPDSKTKLDGLNAIVGIIKAVVSLPQDAEWCSYFQEGPLPKALMSALVKVGKRLSDEEIDHVRDKQDILAVLESAKEFAVRWSGIRTFKNIIEFQDLFIDGSRLLHFHQCLVDIDESFAIDPSTEEEDTLPRVAVERCITTEISWKLNRRSCFETKLNAFKVLAKIGHTFVIVRDGPHAEAFEDGILDKTLTDTMEKICSFTKADFDELDPTEPTFLVDEDFMEDIIDLNIARKASLPGLPNILRFLDIPVEF